MDPSDDDIADAEVVVERPGDDTVEPTSGRHDEIEEAEVVAASPSPRHPQSPR